MVEQGSEQGSRSPETSEQRTDRLFTERLTEMRLIAGDKGLPSAISEAFDKYSQGVNNRYSVFHNGGERRDIWRRVLDELIVDGLEGTREDKKTAVHALTGLAEIEVDRYDYWRSYP